jgi:hypothetical protein
MKGKMYEKVNMDDTKFITMPINLNTIEDFTWTIIDGVFGDARSGIELPVERLQRAPIRVAACTRKKNTDWPNRWID